MLEKTKSRPSATRLLGLAAVVLAIAVGICAVAPEDAFANIGKVSYTLNKGSKDEKGEEQEFTAHNDSSNISDIFSFAKSKADSGASDVTITLYDDWDVSAARLEIPASHNYTINLQGHMIDRKKSSNSRSGSGSCQVIFVGEGATLTINGGSSASEKATEHAGRVASGSNGSKFWTTEHRLSGEDQSIYGGLITGGACDDQLGGGGITLSGDNCRLYLNDVTIAGNVSDTYGSSYGHGGGILVEGTGCSIELSGSIIKWNYAHQNGGGIFFKSQQASLTLKNGSSIMENYAGGNGGGVGFEGTDSVVMHLLPEWIRRYMYNISFSMSDGSTISGNCAAGHGGGLYYKASVPNTKTYIDVSTFEIKGGSKISNNYAGGSGGGFFASSTEDIEGTRVCEIDGNSEISNNEAKSEGGGVYLDFAGKITYSGDDVNPTFKLRLSDNSLISSNKAKTGGGIYSAGNIPQWVSLYESGIERNQATEGEGGGIYARASMRLTVDTNSDIYKNTAATFGGGVSSQGRLQMEISRNSVVRSNVAGEAGGGIYLGEGTSDPGNPTTVSLTESGVIDKNKAGIRGAGICVQTTRQTTISSSDKTGSITKNSISTTDKQTMGAGLFFLHTATVKGLNITGNSAVSTMSSGGGIYIYDCFVSVVDCNVTGNRTGGTNGGGIEVGSTGSCARLNLGGKVVVKGNKNASGDASDVHIAEKAGASASDVENDNNLLDAKINTSTSDPLAEGSEVGLQCWGRTDVSRIPMSPKSENVTPDASLFFSDDIKWSVQKENGVLYLKNTPSTFPVTINSATSDGQSLRYAAGDKVEIDAGAHAKEGYKLESWSVTGLDGVSRLTPESGVVTFTMPAGPVTLTANYVAEVASVKLEVSDDAVWENLGTTTDSAGVTAGNFIAVDLNSKAVWYEKGQADARVTEVSCTSEEAEGKTTKHITYTMELDSNAVPSGFVISSDREVTGVVYVTSNYGTAVMHDVSVTPSSEGTSLTIKGTFDITDEYVDYKTIKVKTHLVNGDVLSQQESKVIKGYAGSVSIPALYGYKFIKSDRLPDGWTLDEGQGLVYKDSVDSSAEIGLLYAPVAANLDLNVTLTIGDAFPTTLDSANVTYSGAEHDKTTQANKGVTLTWKKQRQDGTYEEACDVVEANTTYCVDVTFTHLTDWNDFALGDDTVVTLNGSYARIISSSSPQSVSGVVTTGEDTRYDYLITSFADQTIKQVGDYEKALPSEAQFMLKGGTTASAKITWDTSGVDPDLQSGDFVLSGTFEYLGTTHTVQQRFSLLEFWEPAADPDGGVYQDAQTVTLSVDDDWKDDDVKIWYAMDDLESTASEDELEYRLYEGPITLGNDKDVVIYSYATCGNRKSSSMCYIYCFDVRYTVKYVTGVDGQTIEDQLVDRGKCAERPSDPTFEGFDFAGWLTFDPDTQETSTFDFSTPIEGNTLLYASWVAKGDPTYMCEVTFDTAGGSAVASQTVLAGECATRPEDPTLEGFDFAGWFTADGEEYDFSTPVTGSLTLYARWTAGGEPVPSQDPEPTADPEPTSEVKPATPSTGDSAQTAAAALLACGVSAVAVGVARHRRND